MVVIPSKTSKYKSNIREILYLYRLGREGTAMTLHNANYSTQQKTTNIHIFEGNSGQDIVNHFEMTFI